MIIATTIIIVIEIVIVVFFFIIFQMFLTDIRYCGSWKARSGRHEKEGLIAAVAPLTLKYCQ